MGPQRVRDRGVTGEEEPRAGGRTEAMKVEEA